MKKLDQLSPKKESKNKKKSPAKIDTRSTAENALHVIEEGPSPKIKGLKTRFDNAEDGARKLLALENLLLAMTKENVCDLKTLLFLGFKPAVAEVLIKITKGEATLQDLDEVWES